MRVLVTGTLGFIFSNFVRRKRDYALSGIDKAVRRHAHDNAWEDDGYSFYFADIADQHIMDSIFASERPDIVIGGAAESFVDDSISDVVPFLHSNVLGTQVTVNCCLKYGARYIHISTDEVYGQQLSKDAKPWTEESPLAPRNPYAASKACAELVVKASAETHGLRYSMVRSCNVYGPRQKKENLIPHVLHGLIEQKPIRIHGDGWNFRQYIHVEDMLDGVMKVVLAGENGETYNIGGEDLLTNLDVVGHLAYATKSKPMVKHVEDRKAHDFGYSVNSDKLRALGWKPRVQLIEGFRGVAEYYRHAVGQAFAAA